MAAREEEILFLYARIPTPTLGRASDSFCCLWAEEILHLKKNQLSSGFLSSLHWALAAMWRQAQAPIVPQALPL